jgi:outer membrane protein assembly factor BamB
MTAAVKLAVSPQAALDQSMLQRLFNTAMSFGDQLAHKTEAGLSARARFYYGEAKIAARTSEENARWRMALADFDLNQDQVADAVTLYGQVLADPALRVARYESAGTTAPAGALAEANLKAIISRHGRAAYQATEDQAQAVLSRARANHDVPALNALIDAYPNSQAAVAGSQDLSAILAARGDFKQRVRVLRWLYQHADQPPVKAQAVAGLAQTNAELHHWTAAAHWAERGLRQYPDVVWQDQNRRVNFQQLQQTIRAALPPGVLSQQPTLHLPLNVTSLAQVAARGFLLRPLISEAVSAHPELMLVRHDGQVAAYAADTLAEKWHTPQLGGPPASLLGYAGNLAVLTNGQKFFGISLSDGSQAYQIELERPAANAPPPRAGNPPPQIRMIQARSRQIAAALELPLVLAGDGQVSLPTQALGPWSAGSINLNRLELEQTLSDARFDDAKILGGQLIVAADGVVTSYNAQTGSRTWQSPAALPDAFDTTLTCAGQTIIAQSQIDAAGGSSFAVIDAETGKWRGTVSVSDPVVWRAVTDDGILLIETSTDARAYDLNGDLRRPLWKRDDIHPAYPDASLPTLDGLLLINQQGELTCLSLATGQDVWLEPQRLDFAGQQAVTLVRLIPDQENVIVVGPQSAAAYRTSDGQIAWKAAFSDNDPPPALRSAIIADPYLVLLGYGPSQNTQRAVRLYMINRVNPTTGQLNNGKLEHDERLRRSAMDTEGPVIRTWQIINNGIALELDDGRIYVYQGTPAAVQKSAR